MNNINMLNVPAENRCFCLVNYHAYSEVTDKDGKRNFIDLPKLEPIFARSLEEAKRELATRLNVDRRFMSEWECVRDGSTCFSSSCSWLGFGS